jgi:hypothetical protein
MLVLLCFKENPLRSPPFQGQKYSVRPLARVHGCRGPLDKRSILRHQAHRENGGHTKANAIPKHQGRPAIRIRNSRGLETAGPITT